MIGRDTPADEHQLIQPSKLPVREQRALMVRLRKGRARRPPVSWAQLARRERIAQRTLEYLWAANTRGEQSGAPTAAPKRVVAAKPAASSASGSGTTPSGTQHVMADDSWLLAHERKQLEDERQALAAERQQVAHERDQLEDERQALAMERAQIEQERRTLMRVLEPLAEGVPLQVQHLPAEDPELARSDAASNAKDELMEQVWARSIEERRSLAEQGLDPDAILFPS